MLKVFYSIVFALSIQTVTNGMQTSKSEPINQGTNSIAIINEAINNGHLPLVKEFLYDAIACFDENRLVSITKSQREKMLENLTKFANEHENIKESYPYIFGTGSGSLLDLLTNQYDPNRGLGSLIIKDNADEKIRKEYTYMIDNGVEWEISIFQKYQHQFSVCERH